MKLTLHPDDIVASEADESLLAVVERTHADIDTHEPYPAKGERIDRDEQVSPSAFRLFLKDGAPPKDTVLVRWQNKPGLELLSISKVKLVDRSLLVGDIVKRNVHDAQSGVILNTFTKCTLQPMYEVVYQNSKTFKAFLPQDCNPIPSQFCVNHNDKPKLVTNIPASELMYAEALTEDDLVIYKDWIGRVQALTNNIRLRLSDNAVVEIDDELGEHPDEAIGSFSIGDIVKTKKGILRTGNWVYGSYNANTPPLGTVVGIRTTAADVVWIQRRIGSSQEHEPPYILETSELESASFSVYQRSRRPSSKAASPTVSNSEIDVRLGLRVRFRDPAGARVKYSASTSENQIPWMDRQNNLGYDLNVFDVTKFETTVSVQWQDLKITTERSINLVPDMNIDDEHAAWPGEIAHPLKLHPVAGLHNIEAPEKVGVVQRVEAGERMAQIRWLSESYIHYTRDPDNENAAASIVSRCINPCQGVEEEISLYDVDAPAGMNVRRGDIVLLSAAPFNSFVNQPTDTTWLGEIVDTLLDGALVIRLGAADEVRDVVQRREDCIVAVRSDGTDQMDAFHDHDHDEEVSDIDDSEAEDMDDEWDSVEEEFQDTIPAIRYEDENGEPMDEDEVENEDWESADEDVEMHDAEEHVTPPTSHSSTPVILSQEKKYQEAATSNAPVSDHTEAPAPYMILEGEIPSDHFYRTAPTSTTSAHVKRVQKDHKILRSPSSLPEGVFIRAWESRLDLLRVLIIGPTQTPYENAPFVVDLHLHPGFPAEPPQAHFHSWPSIASIGTLGRVNPNLYEDGKICLSLLGTWEGSKLEGWSASRSTILQVLVSLLGLVLVREPYYNEAGYEALVGDEASKRPSALYSERVFLRAKGFLITALESPESSGLKGLHDIINWTYRDARGPQLLEATIKTVEEILERSQGSEDTNGLTLMSKGACIPLRRVLDRLNTVRATLADK